MNYYRDEEQEYPEVEEVEFQERPLNEQYKIVGLNVFHNGKMIAKLDTQADADAWQAWFDDTGPMPLKVNGTLLRNAFHNDPKV